MQASLIIPVWNGTEIILDCLHAVYAHSGEQLLEVIAVDNASADKSAALIAGQFPSVRLLRQPINLGFAGGVNAGLSVAQGEVMILLNQDCLVQPGWLDALLQLLRDRPAAGIAGCTIFNADGSLNHTGAFINHTTAYGVHLSAEVGREPQLVEYVTGAAMAIRRSTWEQVGRFDEGFYPAYYEESDYCYRARRKGFGIWYAPTASVTHLLSSRDWQHHPLKHTANQHQSRYRFVCKHFTEAEIADWLAAEIAAIDGERYLDQAVGRLIAARATLRNLPDILERRRLDLDETCSSAQRLQLQVSFTQILRSAFAAARRMIPVAAEIPPAGSALTSAPVWGHNEVLRRREYDLLTRIYFKAPDDLRPEPTLRRLIRLLIKRPLSFISGREHLLLAELNTLHVSRLDDLQASLDNFQVSLQAYLQAYRDYVQSHIDQLHTADHLLEQNLALLESLTDYDYR